LRTFVLLADFAKPKRPKYLLGSDLTGLRAVARDELCLCILIRRGTVNVVRIEALRFSVEQVVKKLKTVLRSHLKFVGRAVIFP
jgi:hypothetical protein